MTRLTGTRILAAFTLLLLMGTIAFGSEPKLVLQITVDQFRGDLPARYADRLGQGGLRYLWDRGIVYHNAHHSHANTETIVGHTTLSTGAQPATHGMIGNVWFDREAHRTVYNIEDAAYTLLTEDADVDNASEIDPTQRKARSEGRSPAAILVTTVADEMVSASGGRSRAYGVSVKDRGAVAMAGHAGTAFWFSKASGEFVTSNYYLNAYPDWMKQWNASKPIQRYANEQWRLLQPQTGYLFGDNDDRPWETALPGFGRVFPHAYGSMEGRYFTTLLTVSPAGDELVVDFAKKLIAEEHLGKGQAVDYLSVSLSSTDYVGHLFGPSSLEAEDNILRLDRTLADLLAFVDKQVGIKNTLIVLSADHGGPDTPGYLNQMGIPAGYIDPASWEGDNRIQKIRERFNIQGPLLAAYEHPYIYFHDDVLADESIDLAELEQAVLEEMMTLPGIALAVSAKALSRNQLPDTFLNRAVINNFHPRRSGNVYIVFAPNWFINDFDGLTVASTHGSPWQYDSYVPIVFAGAGLKPAAIYRRVQTIDVAPTQAALLGIRAPSGSSGEVLVEVLNGKR